MDIGFTIKSLREQKEENQEEFGAAIGLSQTAVSQIESGTTRPHLKTLEAISKHLEVPIPMMYILSAEASDVPEGNAERFKEIWPQVTELAIYVFRKKLE